jgi:hypothetical protein
MIKPQLGTIGGSGHAMVSQKCTVDQQNDEHEHLKEFLKTVMRDTWKR